MSIGDKILSARRDRNLTQEQLAELLGVTRQSISRWEQNQAYPEMEKILRLSDILDVSCDYLLKDNVMCKETNSVNNERMLLSTRLLVSMVGKKAKLILAEGEFDSDYSDKVCKIIEVEDDIMKIGYEKNKEMEFSLINISKIAAIHIVED